MTGGLSFSPIFQGELPDNFGQINNSIRNQYVLTYRPTNNKNDGSYRKFKVLLVDNEGHPLQMQDEKGSRSSTPSSPATATTPSSLSNEESVAGIGTCGSELLFAAHSKVISMG